MALFGKTVHTIASLPSSKKSENRNTFSHKEIYLIFSMTQKLQERRLGLQAFRSLRASFFNFEKEVKNEEIPTR
jgi:hypothetical protein